MLSKELLERFKGGEVVFHTPTQEIFNRTVEAVKEAECKWRGGAGNFFERKEFTCIDNEDTNVMTYCIRDFDSESIPRDIEKKLIEITRAIAYCRKLEETYDADLELDGLYTAREEILRELEDSLEVHI